jgi:GxxExxY protein
MTEILFKELSYAVTGAAMEVHRELGPGFLEAVYQQAMVYELNQRNIPFEAQKALPVYYKGELVGEYKADIVVDGKIILELKSVSALNSAHEAQALHYLAATGLHLAIFAVSLVTKRIVK